MTWTCEQIEAKLSEYVDRLLSPADREAFRAHAEGCARCRPLVARVSGMVHQLHALEPLEPPLRLANAILERTVQPRQTQGAWSGWLRWMQPLWHPRFAMGLATVTLMFFFVSQALGVRPTELTWKDLNPVTIYRAADRQVHLLYGRSVKFFNDLRVVYEIQTRLRPETLPPAEPEPRETPPEAPASQPGKQRNQADEISSDSALLAFMMVEHPWRNLR